MKPTFVVLLAAVGLAVVTGGAAADQSSPVADGTPSVQPVADAGQPGWPGQETTNESDETESDGTDRPDETTSVSPGQQLTGAVGAQGASVQGELLNRSLSGQLANATTPDQRAAVIANETESLSAYLDTLEGVRENLTESWERDELSKGEYRAALTEFVVRARTVERRANRTARAAERLPESARWDHAINATRIWDLGAQARALYQFEDPVARDVVNETLGNGTDRRTLADGRSGNRTV
ncbi:hypothetical protein M0R88_01810 [Halorussus gelatinilyticus]|uniref:DUF7096 domain-containing protein n=1 Tax=Halorussus gelatinilyticus TaxID=2937524 RepID=A0A8U0IIC1_9EURY|nr:hypothetical protein [Halorussus gelatinilyticus]UPW00850.1 hypothetical protein M0R88_01810 [Halorussus gelatinilyticus]